MDPKRTQLPYLFREVQFDGVAVAADGSELQRHTAAAAQGLWSCVSARAAMRSVRTV